MTQTNNEREIINKLALECGLILKTTNLDLCPSYLTKLEAFAKAYAISHNEQQEVVAYADSALVCTISTHMIKELESRNENNKFPYHLWPKKLYTSPPKQIPDGWISVDIRLPSAMQEVLLTNSDGYFVHGKPLFHNSTGEFNCWIYTLYSQDVLDFITQYRPTHWMPLPPAPTTSKTNTEVGND